jgi:TolB-like protein
MSEGTQRRLAAIVSADVVGYSRLMGVDESGTIVSLRAHRSELIDPKIAEHHGRIVKTMGDGLLLEFPSVVDATQCSIEVQLGMDERNRDLDEDRRIIFRVGINLGDIIIDGDDILGDGVNVAARLQEIAEPGGIAVSGRVHEDIRDRLDNAFIDTGERELKNIARPVRIWTWSPSVPQSEVAVEQLPLPDKPSIAVLPFDNMSGDPEQEYFSDGMTEDIITALSRLRWLFVIARNSSFIYKGQAIDVIQVGRELGVRYVLEGSVRRSGQRIRVTAQLIEAENGSHIWAERYDRDLVDIFDLQDELTEAISAQVNAELADSERDLARKKPTTNLDAWDYYQRGMWHFYKTTKEELVEASQLFHLALERAPEFASPYATLANVAFTGVIRGYFPDIAATLEQGLRHAERAVELDDREGAGHYGLGRICILLGDRDRAVMAMEKCVKLSPSSAEAYFGLGYARYWFGRAEEAIPLFGHAIRLSPYDPQLWAFHHMRSSTYLALDEFDLAINDAKAALQAKGNEIWPQLMLAQAYGELEKNEEARAAYDRARKLLPKLSTAYLKSLIGTLHPPYLEKMLDALRKAGMPEE